MAAPCSAFSSKVDNDSVDALCVSDTDVVLCVVSALLASTRMFVFVLVEGVGTAPVLFSVEMTVDPLEEPSTDGSCAFCSL